MIEMQLLAPSKKTDNKLRWARFIDEDKNEFKLYIPKWRVPEPWPARIRVSITAANSGSTPARPKDSINPIDPIRLRIIRHTTKVRSVRFTLPGKPDSWELGEPYIPYSLLPSPDVKVLDIEVHWDMSTAGQF